MIRVIELRWSALRYEMVVAGRLTRQYCTYDLYDVYGLSALSTATTVSTA